MTTYGNEGLDSTESDGATDEGALLEAAQLVNGHMAHLMERLIDLEDRRGANTQLERTARSAQAEYGRLRRHLERGDDEQAIQSMERLLKKIVRLQRRLATA